MKSWLIVLLCSASLLADTKTVTTKQRLVRLAVPAAAGVDVTWEAKEPLDLYLLTDRTAEGAACAYFYVSGDKAIVTSDVIDWDARKRTKDTWVITVDGDAPPPPVPPTPPAPKYGLADTARTALANVSDKKLQAGLASNFAAAAAAIEAGKLTDIATSRTALQAANRKVLGTDGEAVWRTWLVEVGRAVDALEDSGRIANVKDYGVAMREIAEGLK